MIIRKPIPFIVHAGLVLGPVTFLYGAHLIFQGPRGYTLLLRPLRRSSLFLL